MWCTSMNRPMGVSFFRGGNFTFLPTAETVNGPNGSPHLGQLALEDLAGGGHRELVDELHDAGVLVRRHLVLGPVHEGLLGDVVVVLVLDDDGLDLLAVALVR